MDNNSKSSAKMTFWISLAVMIIFVFFGVVAPESFGNAADVVFKYMKEAWGWSFIFGASIFLVMTVFLLLSPVGQIRLGGDDEKPAYSNLTWFAMLFSCGMGIGLLFWGVSEPIWHYMWPPHGEAKTAATVHLSMQYAFFHWGFHPWAIYTVVAASLAYFSYRKGLPMLLSSCLEPILGRKGVEGPWGMLVNVIGVFATLFGLATSLGLGAMQIGGGLESLFGFTSGPALWVTIVIVATLAAIISTSTGIDRGIKYLSNINIVVAVLLMLLVFIIGPTVFILKLLTQATGDYLQNIIQMSFGLDAAGAGTEGWYNAWTVFYWAWWIAWAPFVGTFIARVSRGRTIRNFIVGVMLVPVAVSMVWFAVFGGSALYETFINGNEAIMTAVNADSALGFFALLQGFPLSGLLIFVAMFSVIVFFVTSSDSGTYVNGMLTSGGNPDPPLYLRIVWGSLEGIIAAILLFTGGLKALQTASVVGGFPFMIIMLLMLYCLMKALFAEMREGTLPLEKQRIKDALAEIKSAK
ncbi:MAG: BCCT family transporter [Desulfotignum sp.]|nr:BCCT family transporter [Desulfotignum sp.]